MIGKLLSSDAFWVINKHLTKIIGCHTSSLFLSDLINRQDYFEKRSMIDDEGFFFCKQTDIESDTMLTPHLQNKSIKRLENLKLIETKFKGIPKKKFYKVHLESVTLLFNLKNTYNDSLDQDLKNFKIQTSKNLDSVCEKNSYLFNNNKEIIIKNNNKECVEKKTLPKYLNEIQEFEVVDNPDSRLTADIKNKYYEKDFSIKDEKDKVRQDLRVYIWQGIFKKHNDKNYPARWDLVELEIKTFLKNFINKDHCNNQFYPVFDKIDSWIEEKFTKWKYSPYHEWNKTKEELKVKSKSENGFKDYYDQSDMRKFQGEQLKAYENHLKSLGFTKQYHNVQGTIWKDKFGQRVN